MAKDNTYWFPHDYEPTADFKMQALIGEHGGFGYGIYWRFVEMLHSEGEHKLPLKPYLFLAIAKQMQASAEQVEVVLKFAIDTCELFQSDGKFFWSDRVNRNLDDRAQISQKRSIAGKKGANAKQLLQANKQSVAQDRTGQDRTINNEEWELWGKSIVQGNDHFWEQMKGYKVDQDYMDNFLSVATRNNWKMDNQQAFRTSLKGFKPDSKQLNGTHKPNPGKI